MIKIFWQHFKIGVFNCQISFGDQVKHKLDEQIVVLGQVRQVLHKLELKVGVQLIAGPVAVPAQTRRLAAVEVQNIFLNVHTFVEPVDDVVVEVLVQVVGEAMR
ncbi:hypothetical protein BpHYR1_029302 [Brachionus plicatilis]|uniref:Uncharacterized protein n=1 Tax=Brachionus plicatilis TaxID=10195 RepID=A0A3M7PBU8_BRAPC|nr:hypothetical protein BpHYR1_029302 [Brachionus plicatilis]